MRGIIRSGAPLNHCMARYKCFTDVYTSHFRGGRKESEKMWQSANGEGSEDHA